MTKNKHKTIYSRKYCRKVSTKKRSKTKLQLQVAGIAAVLVYFVDGIFKLKDYRQRIQAARIASTGDDNIEADDGDIDEETIRNTNRNGDVDVPINT